MISGERRGMNAGVIASHLPGNAMNVSNVGALAAYRH